MKGRITKLIDADGDGGADQALDEALDHERHPDEPVGGADELHHLDLAPPGEHRHADRVEDEQAGGDEQQDDGDDEEARRRSC